MKIQKYLPVIFPLLFGLLLGWGILLRAFPISEMSLWMDEGYSFLAAKTMLETGGITLPSGVEYGFFHSLFHLIQAGSMAILGENEWGFRFPSFLFSLLTAFSGFFAAKKLFPKKKIFALLVFTALLFSAWEISWAVEGRMYAVLQFFFCGAIFFLWRFFQELDLKNFLLFLLFSGLAIFCHPFGFFALALFFLFPFFRFDLISQKEFRLFLEISFAVFLFSLFFFFSGFFEHIDPQILFYARWFWDAHAASLFLNIFSLGILFWRGNTSARELGIFLFSVFLFVFFAVGFFVSTVNYRYLFPVFPLLVFLIFLGISFIPRKWFFASFFFTFLFFAAEGQFLPKENILLESDLQKYEGYRAFTPQPDFRAGFEFLKKNRAANEFVITSAPEIALFYGIPVDAIFPFDWESQKNWDEISRPKYVNIPQFPDLFAVNDFIKDQHGWVIFDEYARQKMPAEIAAYIETNGEKVFEKIENQDSAIFIYRF